MRTIFERIAPHSVGIKICGITNPEDAAMCIEAGVDALGLNFFSGSKRFIDLPSERKWIEKLPASILRVAVTVNPSEAEAMRFLEEAFIDALQLHGEESPEFCENLRSQTEKPIIKALRIGSAADLQLAESFANFPILLDAFSASGRGGTGHRFDWQLLENFPRLNEVILSGGLTPENILTALRLTKVRFVDLASGSEEHPRKKSEKKIKHLVAKVRTFVV